MKNIKLSELKQLNSVKEVSNSKMTDLKGGSCHKPPVIKLIWGIIQNGLGFIPPPGI